MTGSDLFKYILSFFLLVFLQIFILNNLQLNGYLNPYLYILFILILPFQTPLWLLMILSFAMGITIDMFSDTAGLHSAVCVLLAYCRRFILKLFSPREGYNSNESPSMHYLGLVWYLWYAGLSVLLHHSVFFLLEAFRWKELGYTLTRLLLSSMLTLFLIIVYQYLVYKPKSIKT